MARTHYIGQDNGAYVAKLILSQRVGVVALQSFVKTVMLLVKPSFSPPDVK